MNTKQLTQEPKAVRAGKYIDKKMLHYLTRINSEKIVSEFERFLIQEAIKFHYGLNSKFDNDSLSYPRLRNNVEEILLKYHLYETDEMCEFTNMYNRYLDIKHKIKENNNNDLKRGLIMIDAYLTHFENMVTEDKPGNNEELEKAKKLLEEHNYKISK